MNQDLSQTVMAAVAALATPEKIAEQVEKHVSDLISNAVKESLRSYSDNGKLITEAIQNSLKVRDLDLPAYGLMVRDMLRVQIEAVVADLVAGQLKKDMDELLGLAPKTIKLSEIVKELLENSPFDEVFFEVGDGDMARWVYMDEDPTVTHRHGASIQLLIGHDGTIAGGTVKHRDLKKSSNTFGHFYGLDQKLRAYHACGTVIELDEHDVVTTKGDY